jgi:hypothetical protein
LNISTVGFLYLIVIVLLSLAAGIGFGTKGQERPMSVEAFQEMIHPEDREFLFRATQEARSGGRPDVEFRIGIEAMEDSVESLR